MPKYHPIYIATIAKNAEAVKLAFVYADDSIETLDEYQKLMNRPFMNEIVKLQDASLLREALIEWPHQADRINTDRQLNDRLYPTNSNIIPQNVGQCLNPQIRDMKGKHMFDYLQEMS